jgi:RNA polymerase sigma-70 factor, ECF subfamily
VLVLPQPPDSLPHHPGCAFAQVSCSPHADCVEEIWRKKFWARLTGRLAASRASVQGVEGNDTLLAARLAAGDDHALAEIFDRLGSAVYGGALRVLGDGSAAQDVLQDVFVELWSHPDRYDPAAGTLRTYLSVLARHRAVDLLRSELRRVARQERNYRLEPAPTQRPAWEQVMTAETAAVVQAAVRLLPNSQRQVVELAYFEGLTCREIADAVGIPEGTAKSRLRLALAKLETALDLQLLDSS